MRILFIFFTIFSYIYAGGLDFVLKANGNVMDLVYYENQIFYASDKGIIGIYDLESKKLLKEYKTPYILDFTGDKAAAKIYSIDVKKDEILVVSQGNSFYRNLILIKDGKNKFLINSDKKFMIKKAKFLNASQILIATLANEIILYDYKINKIIYKIQISQSQFSDFALNKDKNIVAIASESGEIILFDIQKKKIIKILSKNVDNIYKLSYENKHILTAGQDRRAIIYNLENGEFFRFNASFLIYACSLNKDASKAAIAIDEENNIAIFDLKNKKRIDLLKGSKSTLNTIIFFGENDSNLISSSDDENIIIWSLK